MVPRSSCACSVLEPLPEKNHLSPFSLGSLIFQKFANAYPSVLPPTVFLTGHASLQQAVSAMRAGACHFLTKPVSDEQLLETVREAVEQSSSDALFFDFLQKLTKTEKQIAALIRQGLQTKQIVAELNASIRTVEWHRKNIAKKGYLPK